MKDARIKTCKLFSCFSRNTHARKKSLLYSSFARTNTSSLSQSSKMISLLLTFLCCCWPMTMAVFPVLLFSTAIFSGGGPMSSCSCSFPFCSADDPVGGVMSWPF